MKGDTLLSICIAGEKSWVFATLCLFELAFLCESQLTADLHSGSVTHSVGMKSLHPFLSTVTEKMLSQTATK